MVLARLFWRWRHGKGSEAERLAALNEAGATPGRGTRWLLAGALRDESPRVRMSAIEALGAGGFPGIVRMLAMVVTRDEDPRVRAEAAKTLGAVSHDDAMPALRSALNDPDGLVRAAAATALGELHQPRAVSWLEARLRDEDEFVRLGVLMGLAGIGTPLALGAMADALADHEPRVRARAGELLCLLGGEAVLQSLISRLDHHQGQVREDVVRLLGRLGDRRALPGLLSALSDEDANVRAAAVTTLGSLGDPKAEAAVRQMLRDAHPAVREAAAEALRSIASNPLPPARHVRKDVEVERQRPAIQRVPPGMPYPDPHGRAVVRRIPVASTDELPSSMLPPASSSPPVGGAAAVRPPRPSFDGKQGKVEDHHDPVADKRLSLDNANLAERIRERLRDAAVKADGLIEMASAETVRRKDVENTFAKMAKQFEEEATIQAPSEVLRTPGPVIVSSSAPTAIRSSEAYLPPGTLQTPDLAPLAAGERTLDVIPDSAEIASLKGGLQAEPGRDAAPSEHAETIDELGGEVTRKRTRSTDLAPLLAIAGRQGPGSWVDDVIESLLRARADELSEEQLHDLMRLGPQDQAPLTGPPEQSSAPQHRIRRMARAELDRRRQAG